MNFIMSLYSEVQLLEKRMQSLMMQIEILSSACVFNLFILNLWALQRQNVKMRLADCVSYPVTNYTCGCLIE